MLGLRVDADHVAAELLAQRLVGEHDLLERVLDRRVVDGQAQVFEQSLVSVTVNGRVQRSQSRSARGPAPGGSAR